jgi:uncharacterized protein YaiE (UPF0345 family)
LGVTPSTWTTYKALQISTTAALSGASGGDFIISNNAVYNSGFNYLTTSRATYYYQYNGQHSWYNSPSGTAGTAIIFTQAMTLDASSNLQLGTTTAKTTTWSGSGNGMTIGGASAPGLAVWDTTDATYIGYIYQANADTAIGNNATGNLTFSTSATERARISSDGTFRVKGAGTAGSTDAFQVSGSAPASAASINSSGNLLVGTTSALASSSGRGNITVNGSTDAILAFGIGAATAGYIYQGASSLIINTQGAKPITFESSGVERGRFSATGALVLQSGDTTANGIGITFPATQSASSNANTLDDYEEGTWTPTCVAGSQTATYTVRAGTYTRIGNIVRAECAIIISTVSGTINGNTTIQGLPFSTSFPQSYGGAGSIGYNDGFVNTISGTWISGSEALFRLGTRSAANDGGGFSAGGYINITWVYQV